MITGIAAEEEKVSNKNTPKVGRTGYPSIDKPWLKYYSKEAINKPLPYDTAYGYMASENTNNLNMPALNYFGRKITYGEMFENIEKATDAFVSLGIKSGDIVTGISVTTPEVVYIVYALNRIGAISNWLDPRTDTIQIINELLDTNTKLFIVLSNFQNQFLNLDELSNMRVLRLTVAESLPILPKIFMGIKEESKPSGWLSYKEFISKGLHTNILKFQDDMSYMPAIMEHTGGTTGNPKAVVLTNQNMNTIVQQYRLGGTQLSTGDAWLSVAFPFTAYALICSLHIPLSCGMCCGLCFTMDLKKIENMLLNGKYNHMANTPVMWEQLLKSRKVRNADLSFLINPIVGADTLNIDKEKEINEFLIAHHCNSKIKKGYGMTEVSSAACVTPTNDCNKVGSVGIPFVNTTISIFDMDTGREMKYNEQGEICITGPTLMKEYFHNKKETEAVIRIHSDGQRWIHSGDLGHMDPDGFVFIDGRIKRMLIDHHGFKIFAPKVEEVISTCRCVDKCCVVGVKDKDYSVGQKAIAYIIMKAGLKNGLDEIKNVCKDKLQSYAIPADYLIVDEFPYTSAAKVDYLALQKRYEQER